MVSGLEWQHELSVVLPIIFGIESLRYLIAAGLCSIILWAFWRAWFGNRKLQERKAAAADYVREIFASLRTALIFAIIGFGMHLANVAGWITIYEDFAVRGPWYFAATLVAMILAHDAYFYWTHRAMHHPKLFRLFHATHHKSRTPTPWTAYSFDIPEAALMVAFVPAWTALIPMHDLGLFSFMTWQVMRNVMGHAGVELSPVSGRPSPLFGWLNTTTHHDLHHQDARTNFGLYFSWWDRWMGTEHPEYQTRVAEMAERSRTVCTLKPRKVPVTGIVAATIAGVVALAASDARAEQPNVYGDWATEGFGAVVRLSPCVSNVENLCGDLAWVWDPKEVEADSVGAPMLNEFAWNGEAWRGGILRNPEDGRTYRGTIRLDGDLLRLKGCAGPFCKSETWRRLESIPRP